MSGRWFVESDFQDGEPRRREAVSGAPFRLGRGKDMELSISEATVSRRHAELLERHGRLFVRDLGSLNGTALNGRIVEGVHELLHGDVLHLAEHVIRLFREAGEAGESPDAPLPSDREEGSGPSSPLWDYTFCQLDE